MPGTVRPGAQRGVRASSALDTYLQAAPLPQRAGLRVLLGIARRPRGRTLLSQMPLAAQAAGSLLAMERYDDPELSRRLGFDAAAVVASGRALRRAEGRP